MVKQLTPSEIQVWYVLPLIRKRLAQALLDLGCTQKRAAELLGITPAAVSQYLSDKRASSFTLAPSVDKEIQRVAMQIHEGTLSSVHATMKLLHHKAMSSIVCQMCKQQDPSVPQDCTVCIDMGLLGQ